ncbi:MAG TPA: serine hydrolase [Rhodanobacteraceae bacterium]|nr:serine hydrolase [Rhodanobacteraceae bacterium]
MQRLIVVTTLAIASLAANAQDHSIYTDGFDPPSFTQRYPIVNGAAQLPATPPANQIQWFVNELASGQNTTAAEVSQHFTSAFDATSIANWINTSLRPFWPDAKIVDVVALTPYGGTVVIDGGVATNPYGFINFHTQYAGSQHLFTLFSAANWGGSVMYPEDQTLTLTQAADKALTLASDVGVLVARINPTGPCVPIIERNSATLRATASIFKNWVLYGMGRTIVDGDLSADETVTLSAGILASGGDLNSEPLGTTIPVLDLAALMMGNSDNTATDLMHHRVGRDRINAAIDASGVANPNVLKPLLDISEQFQFIYSFPASTWQAYIDGDEAYQNQFLQTQVVPRGNVMGSYSNLGMMVAGTWHASPMDVCSVYAANRRLPQGSEAFQTVDTAMAAEAAQPNVRNRWDRVWYKGGSLSPVANKFNVLTHAWLVENAGGPAYFVATMYNDNNPNAIDQYKVQSIAGRILEILADTHP